MSSSDSGVNEENEKLQFIKKKVVIIGAGVSGLTCASELIASKKIEKHDICILEARNRIGGRIHTKMIEYGDDPSKVMSFDFGAAWIHGTRNNPILSNVIDKVELIEHSPNGNLWMSPRKCLLDRSIVRENPMLELIYNGSSISEEVLEQGFDLYEAVLKNIAKIGCAAYYCGEGKSLSHLSAADAIQVLLKCYLSSNCHDHWIGFQSKSTKKGRVHAVANFLFHLIELWHGQGMQNLQLADFASDSMTEEEKSDNDNDGGFAGPHCEVKGGMVQILQYLKEKVYDIIRLESEVVKIHQRYAEGSCIEISCRDGLKVHTNVCIVTIPLGCLQRKMDSLFEPSLSPEKCKAISSLQMVSYLKVLLIFERIWWNNIPKFLGLIDDHFENKLKTSNEVLGSNVMVHNFWAHQGIPALEIVSIGSDVGVEMLDIRREIFSLIQKSIAQQYDVKELQRMCKKFLASRWDTDPFSLGAYSSWKMGANHDDIEHFAQAEWDGKLRFCGEATNVEYGGSIHAAFISAKNVAKEL